MYAAFNEDISCIMVMVRLSFFNLTFDRVHSFYISLAVFFISSITYAYFIWRYIDEPTVKYTSIVYKTLFVEDWPMVCQIDQQSLLIASNNSEDTDNFRQDVGLKV